MLRAPAHIREGFNVSRTMDDILWPIDFHLGLCWMLRVGGYP